MLGTTPKQELEIDSGLQTELKSILDKEYLDQTEKIAKRRALLALRIASKQVEDGEVEKPELVNLLVDFLLNFCPKAFIGFLFSSHSDGLLGDIQQALIFVFRSEDFFEGDITRILNLVGAVDLIACLEAKYQALRGEEPGQISKGSQGINASIQAKALALTEYLLSLPGNTRSQLKQLLENEELPSPSELQEFTRNLLTSNLGGVRGSKKIIVQRLMEYAENLEVVRTCFEYLLQARGSTYEKRIRFELPSVPASVIMKPIRDSLLK